MRTIGFAVVLLIMLSAPTMVAYSHCHNNTQYENPLTVRGNRVWPPEIKNDEGHYEVEYKINKGRSGLPSMVTDGKAAAATWSEIQFRGRTVKFEYKYDGRARIEFDDAGDYDDVNLLSWFPIGDEDDDPAGKCIVHHNGNRILEVDMLLNYYLDWTTHANRAANPTYWCILEVATHEFGHGTGLEDVYYRPTGDDEDMWCHEYQHYTMNGEQAGGGSHWRESLRCEDKYAVDQKYSHGP